MIYNLLDNADNDYEKASKGILAIDEIDKKLGHEDTSNDVAGVEVLKSLLKIIEGTTVKVELQMMNSNGITTNGTLIQVVLLLL